MIAVHLWSSLARFTDGARVVEVEAATVAEALDRLTAAHPGLAPILGAGVAVVIDGETVPNRHRALEPGTEIFLMQQMKGG